jgi:SAM-dependent methyltransferase
MGSLICSEIYRGGVETDPYAAIAGIYDRWCAEVVEDVAFYVARCAGARGPVIEIGAGTGRITVPVALAGHEVVAIDRSAPMLEHLAVAARAAGVAGRVRTVVADIRALPHLPGTDRVIAPFRVLLHLATDEERQAFLGAVAAVLVPGGMLAFDVFSPTSADVAQTHGRSLERPSGVRERALWDVPGQRLDLEVRLRSHVTTMHLHWTTDARWRELLAGAGFRVLDARGGFAGERLARDGGDAVYVAERVASRP